MNSQNLDQMRLLAELVLNKVLADVFESVLLRQLDLERLVRQIELDFDLVSCSIDLEGDEGVREVQFGVAEPHGKPSG